MRRSLLLHLSLAATLATVTAPVVRAADEPPAAPVVADLPGSRATPLAKALLSALQRQDLAAVGACFADQNSPVLAWMTARLDGHLSGRAIVSAWEVSAEPIGPADGDLWQLHVRARLAGSGPETRSLTVRLIAPAKVAELDPHVAPATLSVTAHDLSVALDPAQGRVTASDTLAYAVAAGRTHQLHLAAGLKVTQVTAGKQKVAYRQVGDSLYVTLPADAKSGTLTVHYAGTWPNGPYDFVGPETVLLRPESRWYPQPAGRPVPARYKVAVTVPKGWTGVAPGNLVQGRYQLDRPVLGVAVSAGQWQKRTTKAGKTTVHLYLKPQTMAKADAYAKETGRLLSYCESRLGPYPHAVMTLTESDIASGYGGEAFMSLGSRVMHTPRVRDNFLAHEVLHSWSDRLLASGTEGEAGFLSEGLTTYLAYLWDSGQPDGAPPQQRQAMGQAYLQYRGRADLPIREATAEVGLAPWVGVVYQKGAMVLHDLHRRLGDQAFWKTLRTLFDTYADKPVGIAQLQSAAEAVHGESLQWWFDQWLAKAGAPKLALQDVTVTPDGDGYVIAGRVVQQGEPYRLKLPLWVDTVERREGFSLTLARESQPFAVRVQAYPKRLALDPDYHVLAVRQPPPTLQTLPKGQVLVVVGQQGSDAEEKQAALALGQTLAARYREAGATVTLLTDEEATEEQLRLAPAVCLVGRPGLNPRVTQVPALPLSLQGDRFELGGATYDRPQYGVLQTVPGPWAEEQVVAVFAGLGAPALRQMAEVPLGRAPIEVVAAGVSQVIDTSTYPVLDPRMVVSFEAATASEPVIASDSEAVPE